MTDRIEALVARWIRPEIRALHAYHVPAAAGLVKLDAMENPYSWPPELVEQWLARLRAVQLNRYPDPGATELKQGLRRAFAIPDGAEVVLGNGSDELIQMLCLAVAGPSRAVLAPEPSFVMFRMIAAFAGMQYCGVPLSAAQDFGLDRAAMLAALEEHQPALVFIAYPNNPTGNLFDRTDVEAIIATAPGLVVLDEAYSAFADDSFMDATTAHPNLLVMRTVSKMGLAGLRLGFLAGPPPLLAELDKLRLPYNINVLTQHSAAFALEHKQTLDAQTQAIRTDRGVLMDALAGLEGIDAFPSQANFILFRVPAGQGDAVFARLLQSGVLVKNLSSAGGALTDCLRVTVGRPDENQRFLAALAQALD